MAKSRRHYRAPPRFAPLTSRETGGFLFLQFFVAIKNRADKFDFIRKYCKVVRAQCESNIFATERKGKIFHIL